MLSEQALGQAGFLREFVRVNGRDGEIRTLDLLIPNQARYQAAPRPDQRAAQSADGMGAWQTVFRNPLVHRFLALPACDH